MRLIQLYASRARIKVAHSCIESSICLNNLGRWLLGM
jgi:hypothetical protein